MTNVLWEVPNSWTWVSISAIGSVVSGGTPSTKNSEFWGGGISWISPADLTGYTDKTISKGAKSLTELGLKNSSAKLMPAQSVHFSSRAPIGYVAISSDEICTNQGFKSIAPFIGIYSDFVYFYLKSSKQLAEENAAGTTFKEISGAAFGKLPFPVPPTNEQHRIVAKIEELFSELDKGIESLKTARAQLKIYRQALLKHAFEGKLTEQWRADNASKLETAEHLLACIKQAREARYHVQLEEWKATVEQWETGGKHGKKAAKPRKFIAPADFTGLELERLAELPVGAIWVKVGIVFDVFVGATPSRKVKEYWGEGVPWVSSGEVAFCEISETREHITLEGLNNTSTVVHPAGTVMLAMIGEGKTRGQAAILKIDSAHNQNTAAIRVSETDCSHRLFYFYLLYQYEITRRLGSGNNQKALNKERVSEMVFPLFSIGEQKELARMLDEKLSVMERIDVEILSSIAGSEALRQSILKKAFSGQLVPQDPNDEPAGVLLERIAAEKASAEAAVKAAKPAAKKKRAVKRKSA